MMSFRLRCGDCGHSDFNRFMRFLNHAIVARPHSEKPADAQDFAAIPLLPKKSPAIPSGHRLQHFWPIALAIPDMLLRPICARRNSPTCYLLPSIWFTVFRATIPTESGGPKHGADAA
jgi:hypothetical protein